MNDQQIKQLKKAYEPLRGKKISTDKAMKLSAMVDKLPKDSLVKIYKSDIPFVSTSALTTLMIKHNFKASDLKEGKKELDRWKKSGGEERFLKGAKAAREIIKKLEKGMDIKKHRRESVELDESLESDLTSLSKSGTIQITQGNAQTRSDFYKVLKPFKKWGKSWKKGDAIQIQMGKLVKESVLEEKNVPTNPKLWAKFKAQAKAKFDVYPSAYANGWAAKQYKAAGGGWKTESVKESVELDEGFTPKEIKMAIGIASDKRYAGGNMTGAVNQIEKIKKGLSKHKQVAAVLRRQNESVEKIECPKCDGKGCSHCDDKGYHLKEGYLLEKVGSVKTPYGTVEIKKNPRAGRNQDGYIMVLHGKTKKHYLGSHPSPTDSAVNNIVKNAFKSGWLKEEVELEEKKSVTQQIQDIERMLDRTRGNTSAVKMKRYALKKKLDKLMSMKEEVELEENIIPKGVKLGQKPSKKGHHPDSWVILKLNGKMFGSNSKIVKILKPSKNAPDPSKHGGDAAKRLYILKTKLDKSPESPVKKKFLKQLGEEAMTTNSGIAGLGKDGPADFFLKKRKNLVTKRYIEVNGKLKRREK